jgi:hypothetical protein
LEIVDRSLMSFKQLIGCKHSGLALVLLSVACSMLIAELSLHALYRTSNGSWLWENTNFRVGYTRPIEDRREYSLRSGYTDQTMGITIDQLGLRKTYPPPGINDDLIVCAGDSVPFGAGVRDNETYSSYLAQSLAREGLMVGVINAGVPSYNLRQSFDRLHTDVLDQSLSSRIIVVTLEAANDISLVSHYKEDWNPDRTWAQVRWSHTWLPELPIQGSALAFYLHEYNHLQYEQ